MKLRKQIFACMLLKTDQVNHLIYGMYKSQLFGNLNGLVVEIGPGSGINFRYLPNGLNWVGIEPNEAFHKVLLAQAGDKEINAKLYAGDASLIPLPDNTADFILCTLVLCSVADPSGVMGEMKRVLKPGGKLIFIEHVAAPKQTLLRSIQNLINPLNRFMADGCNCNRETWTFFENGKFARVELSHHDIKGVLPFHRPHIMGFAVK
jgi:ubiquinone/menaquinone biosynthesis C-methylase UbiE